MGDAQKSFSHLNENGEAEKVHIPDSFVDSDDESDTMSDKLRNIGAYGDEGQECSKSSHQLWVALNGTNHNSGMLPEGSLKTKTSEP